MPESGYVTYQDDGVSYHHKKQQKLQELKNTFRLVCILKRCP